MNEESIINHLTLYAFNYHRFGNERDKEVFTNWMDKLQQLKKFGTQEEACNYFVAWGERDEKLSA